jgi:catechol 2,3-dioxygenase-like lactoylglutathione lyase family enzyme
VASTPERSPRIARSEVDRGLTHVALPVADLDRSIAFYEHFADLHVVHRRVDDDEVAWLADGTRPFVVVLIQSPVSHTLGGWSHLGVACTSRAEVDERLAEARKEGHEVSGPIDHGPPVGYWGIITDPDGHNLELSFGQDVGSAARGAASA